MRKITVLYVHSKKRKRKKKKEEAKHEEGTEMRNNIHFVVVICVYTLKDSIRVRVRPCEANIGSRTTTLSRTWVSTRLRIKWDRYSSTDGHDTLSDVGRIYSFRNRTFNIYLERFNEKHKYCSINNSALLQKIVCQNGQQNRNENAHDTFGVVRSVDIFSYFFF